MRTGALLRHHRRHGCVLRREGGAHSIWANPRTGEIQAVPRHGEISNVLARSICRGLSVPEIGRQSEFRRHGIGGRTTSVRAMSHHRKAHSVEIIDRRLRTAESADAADAMELVGLHDELARVERKWIGKRDAPRPGGRPLSDAGQLDQRFERLRRLVDAALRRPGDESNGERRLLRSVAASLSKRVPLAPGGPS